MNLLRSFSHIQCSTEVNLASSKVVPFHWSSSAEKFLRKSVLGAAPPPFNFGDQQKKFFHSNFCVVRGDGAYALTLCFLPFVFTFYWLYLCCVYLPIMVAMVQKW